MASLEWGGGEALADGVRAAEGALDMTVPGVGRGVEERKQKFSGDVEGNKS